MLKNADLHHPSCKVVMYRRKSASPVLNVLRHLLSEFQCPLTKNTGSQKSESMRCIAIWNLSSVRLWMVTCVHSVQVGHRESLMCTVYKRCEVF